MYMKILFLYARSGKKLYQESFERTKDIIKKDNRFSLILLSDDNDRIVSEHYKTTRRAIFEADAVIIDNSHSSFKLGHEATLAIKSNKPTLVISQHENLSKLISHKLFFGAKYKRLTQKEIIKKFLDNVDRNKLSERINLFISKDQKDHLLKNQAENKQNFSEYIRELIDKDIEQKRGSF